MAEEHSPTTAPVQTYLEITHKIDTEEGEYPLAELTRDFARIILSCKALITQNSNLSSRILSTEALLEEQTVQIFQKDMEIHELKQTLKEKDPDVI
jgi:hypothetical protein